MTLQTYKFLARRTDSAFARTVLNRLQHSNTNKTPISISNLQKQLKGSDKTVVVVGTITDDIRVLEVPKINVVALRVTESARERIIKAGGSIKTFDQLILENPTGSNTLLLRGSKDREAKKHFGRAPGLPRSHTKPYVSDRKAEIKNY